MLDRAARFSQITTQQTPAVMGMIASAASFIETSDDKTSAQAVCVLPLLWSFGINGYETHANRRIPPGRNPDCNSQREPT